MNKILIIDDDKLNLTVARKVLCDEYKVIPVLRGGTGTYLSGKQ